MRSYPARTLEADEHALAHLDEAIMLGFAAGLAVWSMLAAIILL